MADILYLDLESRSKCDLKTHGVYNYALDESTEILCMCWALNDGPVQTWLPGQPLPAVLFDSTDLQFRAHNAAFERLMFTHVLHIETSIDEWYCTATQARANCCPGSLADVGRFAGTGMRKDHRGALLIRRLCIPNQYGGFNDDPLLFAELRNYCARDVEVMREVSKSLRELSPEELADYHVNERINDRGVLLDKPLAVAATAYAAVELSEISELVSDITDGAVTSVRSPKMRAWVAARLGPEARKLMTVHKAGLTKESIDKTVRANLLALAAENPDEVPAEVADVIQCADDLWASSVAKFQRAIGLADVEDDRVRGAFVFAGGAATGRSSSYGLQVHNYPRKTAEDPDAVRGAMVRRQPIVPTYGARATDVLKGLLRPSLIAAPGKTLVICDWNAIEARVTPWASNKPADVLDQFRAGVEVYKSLAASTHGIPIADVTELQRTLAKVQILACGFAGGIGAFAAMSRIYNVRLDEDEAQDMVNAWRWANPWAPEYWMQLERAYTRAMRNPGYEFSAGRTTYLFDGVHLWYSLPSGRVLRYPYARFEDGGITYAKCSWKPAADAIQWPRGRLWRGLACENITQAIANDILRSALRELEPLGVVLHIHDEIVVECDMAAAESVAEIMRCAMVTPPAWAAGLPLAIGKPVISTRYGK